MNATILPFSAAAQYIIGGFGTFNDIHCFTVVACMIFEVYDVRILPPLHNDRIELHRI